MKNILIISGLILAAFLMGPVLGGNGSKTETSMTADHAVELENIRIWTCSMHPQIRMNEPGKCPICGMDLIPVKDEVNEEAGPRELKLSPTAMRLAAVQTVPVVRKYVTAGIRLKGRVTYDETRLAVITARVPGRIDRLYVDYTGIPVKLGDHMVYLYSPELLTAQEELLQAKRSVDELKQSSMKIMREIALQTLDASREKLRLWGLTEKQISQIEKRGRPSDHMTIYAPIGGIVIQKNVQEGNYITTGTRLYTIADLSRLWIMLDAYESDLIWLRYGQKVSVETEAYPGDGFKGTIAFINPVLDSRTRTVNVRVNVDNEDGRLKPDMFVHATVHARVAAAGKVMEEALAGKWICPMHPDVIRDVSGSCDICGMPLVRTESLGYASADQKKPGAPLVIPDSAPLITGKRAVVYVADPEHEGIFEGREIVLGPRAGDFYLVNEGLKEGEEVVVNGNFKIDSDLQIQAKPSMMNPEGGGPLPGQAHHGVTAGGAQESKPVTQDHTGHDTMKKDMTQSDPPMDKSVETPMEFQTQIDQILSAYFNIRKALSRDDAEAAEKGARVFSSALDAADIKRLTGHSRMIWMKEVKELKAQVHALQTASNISKQREAFALLSESVTSVIQTFGTSGKEIVLQFYCPMAFGGRGAHWLQNETAVQNPYFGKTMFKCGEKTATLVKVED